jgi:hypothetical protein
MFSENASFPPVCLILFLTPFIFNFSLVKFNTPVQAEKNKKRPVGVGRGHETFFMVNDFLILVCQ